MPRAVVTGGAGFLGSHLCSRLLAEGWELVALDSLITGARENLADLEQSRFRFAELDITNGLDVDGPLDWVLHLASPASPVDYLRHPLETLEVGSTGTTNALEFASAKGAALLLASSSEVYGDPLVHPQVETYWGNANPVGPRSVYDESKRYAEAVTVAYQRYRGVSVRVARIFNTYGPRMRPDDGRAVPTFIRQALRGEPITVHGDGGQTRSLCYVDDTIEGLVRLIQSDVTGPVNIGSPNEIEVLRLAELIREIVDSPSTITFVELPEDDPQLRCPDISLARSELGWEPKIELRKGLERTVAWAREAWR
ncbi:MAG: UDP-glucuronic acid decarboxylase family protein [Actinomycetota bacterium]